MTSTSRTSAQDPSNPLWHPNPPPTFSPTFHLACNISNRNSNTEYRLLGKDHGGLGLERLIEQLRGRSWWMSEEEVGEVIAQKRRYPRVEREVEVDYVTSLATHPTEQSTAPTLPAFLVDQDDKFFEFEGSIPRDCQPREGIEVKREESEILTIEVIRGEFERLDKGLATELQRVRDATEKALNDTTSTITLPFDRIISPLSPHRQVGDYDHLKLHPELLVSDSSPRNYFVLAIARMSLQPEEWVPNDAVTAQAVRRILRSLMLAGLTAAVEHGLPLDRVYVVTAIQIAGLQDPPQLWQLCDIRIIPAQHQGVTQLPILHWYHLIVVYGSTGAGQLFFDIDLLAQLAALINPPPPPPAPPQQPPPPPPHQPPHQPPPPPPPLPPHQPPRNPPANLPPANQPRPGPPPPQPPRQPPRTPRDSPSDPPSDPPSDSPSNISAKPPEISLVQPTSTLLSNQRSSENYKTPFKFKSSVEFCFIIAETKNKVFAYWCSIDELISTAFDMVNKRPVNDIQIEEVIRDLVAHIEGRKALSKGMSEGMKAAQRIVNSSGVSGWKYRIKSVENSKTVRIAGITSSSLASASGLSLPELPRAPSPRSSDSNSGQTRQLRNAQPSKLSGPQTSVTFEGDGTTRTSPPPRVPRITSARSPRPSAPYLPPGFEELFDGAQPLPLTSHESALLSAYPTFEEVFSATRLKPQHTSTLPKLLRDELDTDDEEDFLNFLSTEGPRRALECDFQDCLDSFHLNQAALFEFHKLYHSLYQSEMAVCVLCGGYCPERFMRAHLVSCDGMLNQNWTEDVDLRKNEYVYWFSY
ncbi:hypothetical protein JCM5353_003321 [Sporobolomyces roseus]